MHFSTLIIAFGFAPLAVYAGPKRLHGDDCMKNCVATFEVGHPMGCKTKEQCANNCLACYAKGMDVSSD